MTRNVPEMNETKEKKNTHIQKRDGNILSQATVKVRDVGNKQVITEHLKGTKGDKATRVRTREEFQS